MRNSGKFGNIFIALLIAASFAIAGCGGGGGTAQMPEPDPPVVEPEPTAQEICEGDGGRYNADGSCTSAADVAAEMAAAAAEAEALSGAQDAAMAAYTAAMEAVYGAKDPIARENAHMYAAMAGTANEAAQAATDSATAIEHQMAAETASASAVEAGMTHGLGITKLANAVANKDAIDSAGLVGTPAPAPVSNAGRVGLALLGEGRTPVVPTFPNDADDGKGGTVNKGQTTVVTARHTGTAPRFTVTATVPTLDDTSGTNAEVSLIRGEDPVSVMMRGDWEGADLVAKTADVEATARHDEKGKINAIVFTDINPPAQSYNAVDETDAANDGVYTTDEITDDTNSLINKAVVTVDGEVPGDGSHFVAEFNMNPTDNEPAKPGRFFCPSGEACSISVDASGVLTAIQGYQFQSNIAGSIMRGDSDYLAWGVWLHVPDSVPGPDVVDAAATVASFAYGNDVFAVSAALTGTATYNGVATGLYTAEGMVEYFDADVTLEADFGSKSANDSTPQTGASNDGLLGAVRGSVTSIKAGGMDVDGSITLGRAPLIAGDDPATIQDSVTAGDPATSFNGRTEAILGSRSLSGTWGGRFYGPNKAAAGSVAQRSEFPTTAAGTFGAGSVQGAGPPHVSILGAFGTWKAPDPEPAQ